MADSTEPLTGSRTSGPFDRATVLHCLELIDKRSGELKDKGLNSWRFFFGVSNTILLAWVFGAAPAHFWVVYLIETGILFSIRWVQLTNAKPLSEVFYWLDYCWVCNIISNITLGLLILDTYCGTAALDFIDSNEVRQLMFCVAFGFATGPLLCAVGALGNALVFHDATNTVSVFIHLFPALLMYTMRWRTAEVVGTYPHLFHLNYFDKINPWKDIYVGSLVYYFAWFVPYTLWLVVCGMKAPSKGYDTVFHSLMRGANPVAGILGWSAEESKRRAEENDFTVASALIYMGLHAGMVAIAGVVAVGCFVSPYFHGGVCLLMCLSCVYNGSRRYAYYMLENYASILKKEIKDLGKDV